MDDPLSGMSDTHERLEKLERRVKILETTLQFFFQFPTFAEEEIMLKKYSKEYP
jgi:hypothetical protein